MKILAFFSLLLIGATMFAQDVEPMQTCAGLPVAAPDVHAVCITENPGAHFERSLPAKLKTGTHMAVFKVTVDCNGSVTKVQYERGTFTSEGVIEEEIYLSQHISGLAWKAAEDKSRTVNSFVFVSLEIVNGRVTVVFQ